MRTYIIIKKRPGNYKIFDIAEKKTNTRGYWLDQGKLHQDNIKINETNTYKSAVNQAKQIIREKNQLCVFITHLNHAYLVNKNGKVIAYYSTKRIYKITGHTQLKDLINKYKGLTLHQTRQGLKAEVYA
ncbi:hypothetical protein LCGC14_1609810 [marine sediment metagenome]|uniref:Uncharacterized protein n=1 Tax=marine sediment metagenome TaxID=412755 RepID=A0A0F9L8W8_9ZZZZ